ncbi:MAG: hypothetical protein EP298_11560 [Gammaproteobacteria bacterium]|nr:MAG: hypothetical protein EP298_11560 [Gammaproteobacteria bacterium]UTW42104.1 hypothetical protein KFE69_11460 [bacterium SCSIO 12844]
MPTINERTEKFKNQLKQLHAMIKDNKLTDKQKKTIENIIDSSITNFLQTTEKNDMSELDYYLLDTTWPINQNLEANSLINKLTATLVYAALIHNNGKKCISELAGLKKQETPKISKLFESLENTINNILINDKDISVIVNHYCDTPQKQPKIINPIRNIIADYSMDMKDTTVKSGIEL